MVTGDLIADEIGVVIFLLCLWPILWVLIEKGVVFDDDDEDEWEDEE